MRNILVTGGAGYIGSHLVDELVRREYVVTVLDSLVSQVHRSGTWPSYANPKVRYVQGDVTDRATFAPLLLESDAVVHFAAAVGVGQSMYEIDRYVNSNTRGTAVLLDIMANEKHHLQKVLVASSIGVYGEGAYWCDHCNVACYPGLRSAAQLAARDWEQRCPSCGHTARAVPTAEDKPLYRDNIYSMTKYHQEEMVLLIGKTYGIPAVAPRFFNVYGPRQSLSNPYAGVAAIFLSRLLNGKSPVVFEDGGQLRDFVSVHDTVDCLVLMLEKPGADFLPVNIGSGTRITIREIATTLSGLLGTDIAPTLLNQGRAFDIRHNFADISRAQQTLGFAPRVNFEHGMAGLIEWARSSPDGAVDMFERAFGELKEKGLVVTTSPGAAALPPPTAIPPRAAAPAPPPHTRSASPTVHADTVIAAKATGWTWATYGWALLAAAGIAYFLVRMPFQVSDNIGNLLTLYRDSLGKIMESQFGSGPYLRPFLWGTLKIVFDWSGGQYFLAFKTVHVVQVVLLLLLFARLLAVRTKLDFIAVPLAFAVLLGLHTFGGLVLEGFPINTFLTIAVLVLAALNLAESNGGTLVNIAAPVILVIAMLTVESGLLVWVALMTAYLAGARGVSSRSLVATTLLFAGYFVLRFVLLPGGSPGLEERSTGYGFGVLDPDDLVARFGGNPLGFYAYNIASSFASVLLAEPRAGVWEYTRAAVTEQHEVIPWMTINVVTSALTSLLVVAYTLPRIPRWIRRDVRGRERLVVYFWALVLANAVISFPYTKDQIMTPAGCVYALAAYVAIRDILQRGVAIHAVVRTVLAVMFVAMSMGWTVRTAGLHYNLSLAAFRNRTDWLEVEQWMKSGDAGNLTPAEAEFVLQFKREAQQMPVPHPYLIYGRPGSRYFDQH
jgi:dTDP-L-rhamnose 4-epimerase